jgi:hypothetical protein
VPEVEIEKAEDEAEGGADADDLREDDREHLIKGNRSKDDSEDPAIKEVTKQNEAPKNRESIKKEPASATIFTDATGIKTETNDGAWEDTVEVDKNETNEEDMTKQDKTLFNRENAPEGRTEAQRKPSSRHSKNWTLRELMKMLMTMLMLLMLLMLQVDVVTARDCLGQGQVEQYLRSLGCRLTNAEHDLDHRRITGAAMLKNNPDGKHDGVNMLRDNMSAQEDRFDKDTVEEKTVVKTQPHGKPETRDVMNDITGLIVRNTEYDGMLKTNPKEINMFKVPEMRMLKTIPKGKYDKDVNMDHVMDKKAEMNVNVDIITANMHNTEYKEVE